MLLSQCSVFMMQAINILSWNVRGSLKKKLTWSATLYSWLSTALAYLLLIFLSQVSLIGSYRSSMLLYLLMEAKEMQETSSGRSPLHGLLLSVQNLPCCHRTLVELALLTQQSQIKECQEASRKW